MGQQQLLLIVLGIVVVGLAILVGINIFTAHAVEAKRDLVLHECVELSSMAQQYYRKPAEMGGGNRTFTGWEIPPKMINTANGNFTAVVNSSSVEITGTGNEVVTGSDSVKVKVTVYPDNYTTIILN
ncbi:hypothetical protein BMS3Abin04_01975 [bacterium BMS3Abin04]|nr:hypothetical protein BMS3Abin04_01975 [bacterium BMS3Abin04]